MEGRLWSIVVSLLAGFEKYPRLGRYPDRDVLMVLLWAVLHDRPVCWACCKENWPAASQLPRLPHPSTMSRRTRRPGMTAQLQRLHRVAVDRLDVEPQAMIDGKALVISDLSKDPDATNGRGTRGMARGYKLHAVISARNVIEAFEVQPLNVNERVPAKRLLRQLPPVVRRVVADGNYDGASVHAALEGSGVLLYTPIMNHYASPRSHPRRRRLLRIMDTPAGQKLLKLRDNVERSFGLLCNLGFGLKGLPSWIRRLHRVRCWISGKILLHNAYLLLKRSR